MAQLQRTEAGSAERMPVGQSNALRMNSSGRSASRGPSSDGHHRTGPESSTPETDRKFPFTIKGSQEDFGHHLGSQTRSRTKDGSNRCAENAWLLKTPTSNQLTNNCNTIRRDPTRSAEVEREDNDDDSEAMDRLSELPNDALVQPNNVFRPSTTFPFLRYVLCWVVSVSLAGATFIFLAERSRFTFFDCFFLSMAVTTSSGLTTINVLSLSSASLSVLVLLALLGTYLPTFLMHLNSIETHLDPARAAMRFVVCVFT